MAKNRYGWEKRAKEMARKQKQDEKMKRRQQGRTASPRAENKPEAREEFSSNAPDSAALGVRQDS
jgi:hypothetical protein